MKNNIKFAGILALAINLTATFTCQATTYTVDDTSVITTTDVIANGDTYSIRLHFEDESKESDVVALEISGPGEALKRYLKMYEMMDYHWHIEDVWVDEDGTYRGKLLLKEITE